MPPENRTRVDDHSKLNVAMPTNKLAGDRPALLVVDVQRDFCPGGALAVPSGDRVVPVLNRCLGDALEHGMPIYASRDWHPRITRHFKQYGGEWPPHCVQDTEGARFHPDLDLPSSTIVITKGQDPERPGYSAFEGRTPEEKTLLADMRERNLDHLYVGGLATDYCVKQSVLDAIRHGFKVTVLRDAIAGVDIQPGDSERAIAQMRDAGATMLKTHVSFQAPTGARLQRRHRMPVYEYVCRDCQKAFEIVRPISEAQATDVKCPACGGHHVDRTYSRVYAVTSKKS